MITIRNITDSQWRRKGGGGWKSPIILHLKVPQLKEKKKVKYEISSPFFKFLSCIRKINYFLNRILNPLE
jgi:hypothetical protein